MNWMDFRCKSFFLNLQISGSRKGRTNELVLAEETKIVKMTSSLNNLFAGDIRLSISNVPTACGSFCLFRSRFSWVFFYSENGTWGHDPKEHTERLNCFCYSSSALTGDSISFAEPHGIYLSQVELWHTHNSCEMLFLAGQTTRIKEKDENVTDSDGQSDPLNGICVGCRPTVDNNV